MLVVHFTSTSVGPVDDTGNKHTRREPHVWRASCAGDHAASAARASVRVDRVRAASRVGPCASHHWDCRLWQLPALSTDGKAAGRAGAPAAREAQQHVRRVRRVRAGGARGRPPPSLGLTPLDSSLLVKAEQQRWDAPVRTHAPARTHLCSSCFVVLLAPSSDGAVWFLSLMFMCLRDR